MNIHELQTMVHYKLPVKLFVWNNNGYLLTAYADELRRGQVRGGESESPG